MKCNDIMLNMNICIKVKIEKCLIMGISAHLLFGQLKLIVNDKPCVGKEKPLPGWWKGVFSNIEKLNKGVKLKPMDSWFQLTGN